MTLENERLNIIVRSLRQEIDSDNLKIAIQKTQMGE